MADKRENIGSRSELSNNLNTLIEYIENYHRVLNKMNEMFINQKDSWRSASSDAFVIKGQALLDKAAAIDKEIVVIEEAAQAYIAELDRIESEARAKQSIN